MVVVVVVDYYLQEKEVLQEMRAVFGSEELVELPGLKAQGRRNGEVKVVKVLMHNLVKDGIPVSEINRLLYIGLYVVADRLGLMGKKKKGINFDKKKYRWQQALRSASWNGGRTWQGMRR